MKNLHYFFFIFQDTCMFLSFLIAVRFSIKNGLSAMSFFLLYPTIGFFVAFLNVLSNMSHQVKPIATSVNNVSLIFHYLFLTIFILNQYENKKIIRLLTVLSVFILIAIVMILFKNDISKQNHRPFIICGLWLIVICVGYYLGLLSTRNVLHISSLPIFWIVTGVFFCMSMLIPLLLFRDLFLRTGSLSWNLYFARTGMLCYGIMHIMFIKAYLTASKNIPDSLEISI